MLAHSRTKRHKEAMAARGLTDPWSGLKFPEPKNIRTVSAIRAHRKKMAESGIIGIAENQGEVSKSASNEKGNLGTGDTQGTVSVVVIGNTIIQSIL